MFFWANLNTKIMWKDSCNICVVLIIYSPKFQTIQMEICIQNGGLLYDQDYLLRISHKSHECKSSFSVLNYLLSVWVPVQARYGEVDDVEELDAFACVLSCLDSC